MPCEACALNTKNFHLNAYDCFEAALESLKSHYEFYRKSVQTKDEEIDELKQRNERLTKAVALAARAKPKTPNVTPTKRKIKNLSLTTKQKMNLQKRSKSDDQTASSTTNSKEITFKIESDDEDQEDDDSNSNLNVALHDQFLDLSTTSLSNSIPSPNPSESIAQTERIRSPRVLRTPARRRALLRRLSKTENENVNKTNDNSNKSPVQWLAKKQKTMESPLPGEFLKPRLKQTTLQLKKSNASTMEPKLRQTRLQLDVSKDNSILSGAETTFCEEQIDATPNRSHKISRTWMLRTGSGNNSSNINENQNKEPQNNDELIHLLDDDEDEEFGIPQFKSTAKSAVPTQNQNVFELRTDETLNQPAMDESILKDETAASVVILTPATQDIVFLDNTDINTMDLVNDFMMSDKNKFENLKRYENVGTNKFQAAVNTVTSKKVEVAKVGQNEKDAKVLQAIKLQLPSTSKGLGNNVKIKQEKISDADLLALKDLLEEESEDAFDVRPIQIKMETTNSESLVQRIDIKKKYNIDCEHCQKHIDFMSGLTDKEIEMTLKKCRKHNVEHLPQTPEGYWNPLMESFASDDPRNEVLIDDRFTNIKRK